MYVVCVTVHVKPEKLSDFIAATRVNYEGTRKEPGNVRFDLLQGEDDETRFFLYEVYRDKDGFGAHHASEHYLTWKEKVADWMAKPREGKKHLSLFPGEDQF
jgi:autoinducer 2-degrading protein